MAKNIHGRAIVRDRLLDVALNAARQNPGPYVDGFLPGEDVMIQLTGDPEDKVRGRIINMATIPGSTTILHSVAIPIEGMPGLYVRTETRFSADHLSRPDDKPKLTVVKPE